MGLDFGCRVLGSGAGSGADPPRAPGSGCRVLAETGAYTGGGGSRAFWGGRLCRIVQLCAGLCNFVQNCASVAGVSFERTQLSYPMYIHVFIALSGQDRGADEGRRFFDGRGRTRGRSEATQGRCTIASFLAAWLHVLRHAPRETRRLFSLPGEHEATREPTDESRNLLRKCGRFWR